MVVKDNEIFERVENLKNLYNKIIGNQVFRKRLLNASISRDTWVNIEELFDNIDLYCVIVDCSKKMICKGICDYLPHRWKTILTALNLTKNDRDTLHVFTESIFNIKDNPDVLVTTTTDDFTIRRDILLKDLDKSLDCYSQLCDKFSKNYYIEKVSTLPEEITLKRVDFTLVRQKLQQRHESELEESIDHVVSRIGDEFEDRLRKVFSEYFKKQ